jgi:hypothetical protein
MSVPEAGALLGLSPRASYRAAERWIRSDGREGLPCLRLGERRLVVSIARLAEWLGEEKANGSLVHTPPRPDADSAGG